MADRTIGSLPAAASIEDDSLLVAEQQGEAAHFTGKQLKDYAKSGLDALVAQAQTAADAAEKAATDAEAAAKTAAEQAAAVTDDAKAAAQAAQTATEAQAAAQAALEAAENAKTAAEQAASAAAQAAAGEVKATLEDYVTQAEQAKTDAQSAAQTAADDAVAEATQQVAGYVAAAESAKEAAEKARDEAQAIVGGDFMDKNVYDPTGKARDIFAYVDEHAGGGGATTVVTIPAAWVRGDVNHDGIVDETDKALLQSGTGSAGHAYYNGVLGILFPDGNIPLDYQAADVNNDGIVNITDANAITSEFTVQHGVGVYSADLLGNWTMRSGIDSATSYDWLYYLDTPIEDIKASDKAVVTIKSPIDLSEMTVEVLDGIVRLYCIKPPHIDLTASVTICKGENEVVVVKDFLLSRLDSLKVDVSLTDAAEYDATNLQEMSQFLTDLRYVKFRGECSSFGGVVIEMFDELYPARLTSYTSGDGFALQFYYFETKGVGVVAHTDTLTYDAAKETWMSAEEGDCTGSVTRLLVSPQLVKTDGIPVTVFGDQIASGKHHPVNGLYVRSSTEGSVKVFQISVDDSGTITATEA